tara:strand:+ start:57146 stop:59338 length:2193 start_codon:yes stop_codon:yes gene_type:complete
MKLKNKLIFLFSITLFLPFSLSSEEKTDQTEEVVVVASRIPTIASDVIGSVDLIDSEQIQVQMIDGLEQLVRYLPGISAHKESQYGRSLTEDVHIRGIHGGAIFLIDGIRISDSYVGYGRDTVDTDLLKRVEVLKGPSSVEYGSDGLAGTIAYFTKDPSDLASLDNPYASISLAYDNANNQEKYNFLSAYVGEQVDLLFQIVDRDLEETELHNNFHLRANPLEADQQSLLIKLLYSATDNLKMTMVADVQDWEGEWAINSDERFIYFPSPRLISLSTGEDEGSRERFTLRLDDSKGNSLYDQASIAIFSQETEQSQITIQNQISFYSGMQAAPTPTIRVRDFDFNQSIKGLSFEAYKTKGIHQMVYGVNLDSTETERPRMLTEINLITGIPTNTVDGETYPNKTFPDSETDRSALFFNDRVNIADNQVLNLGFRYEKYELDPRPDQLLRNANILNYQVSNKKDSDFSMKAGYLFDIKDNLTAYTQYAEGFKAPNYENSNIVFTNYLLYYTVVPNPNLESETSKSVEFGLRGFGEANNWDLTFYKNKVKGFIHYEIIGFSQGLGIYQYQNAENVEIEGLEFSYKKDLSNNLSIKSAFALSKGDQIEEGKRSPMIEIDPKELILGLDWTSIDEKFGLQVIYSLSGKSKDNLEPVCLNNSCSPRFSTGGFGILDIFGFYNPDDHIEMRLAIENLTDKKYHRWASVAQLPEDDAELDLYGQSGRALSVSFKYKF